MNQWDKNDVEDSPPILALHGTASSAAQWSHLVAALLGKKDVITPDLPGYGEVPNVQGVGFNRRLQPLMAQFKSLDSPAHLVGHSFGAALALRLAELCPDKCLSVTLYEPTYLGVFGRSTCVADTELFEQIKMIANRVKSADAMGAMSYFIDYWMGEGRWQSLNIKAQTALARYATLTAQDFNDGLFEVSHAAASQSYQGPVKLLYGEQTAEIAKRICQLLTERLPNASLEELANLGHMGPVQRPDVVNKIIMDHVNLVENRI